MNNDRLKKLAGISNNTTKEPTKVTATIPKIKLYEEVELKTLLKEYDLIGTIDSNTNVVSISAELETKRASEDKLLEFVDAWLNRNAPLIDDDLLEGQFTDIADVVDAVNSDRKVYWKTPDYVVSKDLYGELNIVYRPWSKNPNTVGLFHTDGKTTDYSPEDFILAESATNDALYVLKVAEAGSDEFHPQFSGTRKECSDEWRDTKRDYGKGAKHKIEKHVEESVSLREQTNEDSVVEGDNNNFIQPDDVSPDTLNNRMGVDKERKEKVTIPADVKSSITKRISELKTSIEMYDKKGYNDHSQKEKAIDCLEQILDNLSTNDLEGLKKAQIFFETLMSPITDLFPSKLVNWLAKSVPLLVKEAYYDDDGATEELDPGLTVFLNKFATEELRNDAKAGYELAKEKNDSGHSLEELQNYLKNIEDTGAFGEGFAHYTNHAIQQHVPSDWEHSSGSCEW